MRVLIVDDSSVMRKVVERSLRQSGWELTEVLEAANGIEALDLLRTMPALDLILSDVTMPGMGGIEFLETRRAENLAPNVPTVLITSDTSEPLVLRAIAAGARAFLKKPFTADQAKARLAPLLNPAISAGSGSGRKKARTESAGSVFRTVENLR